MKRYYIRKERGIIGGEEREGWAVVKRIGDSFGKPMGAEEEMIGLYRTRREAKDAKPTEA